MAVLIKLHRNGPIHGLKVVRVDILKRLFKQFVREIIFVRNSSKVQAVMVHDRRQEDWDRFGHLWSGHRGY